MIRSRNTHRRTGTTLVEAAVIYSVTFFILLGLVIGGMGIFRYQQMAWLAREAARWASVRGYQYSQETGNAAVTQSDIQTYVQSLVAVSDPQNVTCTVEWDQNNSPYSPIDNMGTPAVNTIKVTVSYNWYPELFLGGYIPLSSTSVMPMSY